MSNRTRGAVIVDTGFFIALGRSKDACHSGAIRYLRDFRGRLLTIEPVATETSFFFGMDQKIRFADYLASGAVEIIPIPPEGFKRIAELYARYADQTPDFTDMALVWLAEATGCHRILTVDKTDFGVYRISGNKPFDLIDWC